MEVKLINIHIHCKHSHTLTSSFHWNMNNVLLSLSQKHTEKQFKSLFLFVSCYYAKNDIVLITFLFVFQCYAKNQIVFSIKVKHLTTLIRTDRVWFTYMASLDLLQRVHTFLQTEGNARLKSLLMLDKSLIPPNLR